MKCGVLNVKLDGILYCGTLRASKSRILERSTRMAACRVSRGRGYVRRSNRMSNGRGCRTCHGRCRTNIGRDEKLCSNLLEEMPVPLSLYPSQLIHSLLQESIREKLPLWVFGPQPPKTKTPVTFLLLRQNWANTRVYYLRIRLRYCGKSAIKL